MRLVAKMAGATVLCLTGTLKPGKARHEPIDVDGRELRFRYDVRWDPRPQTWGPVEDEGEAFSLAGRQSKTAGALTRCALAAIAIGGTHCFRMARMATMSRMPINTTQSRLSGSWSPSSCRPAIS